MRNTLIIGVGNALRGDDAVGLAVAQRLRARLPGISVCEATGEGTALMELWKDAGQVWLIDAIASGADVGTIHRLDVHAQPLPTTFFRYSTHAFGVGEAIEMARVLDQLPPRLIVYGIEGAYFGFAERLSPEVERAASEVVARVQREVEQAEER